MTDWEEVEIEVETYNKMKEKMEPGESPDDVVSRCLSKIGQ